MRIRFAGLVACFSLISACLSAADFRGTIVDPSGAPVPGAQISVVSRVGMASQTVSAANGSFLLNAEAGPQTKLVVTAPGFETKTVALADGLRVELQIAPQVDSVRVVGTAIDVPASEQGSSLDIIPREEIASRNEPMAFNLLRYVPGIAVNQTGAAGGVSALYIRGGQPNFTLVEIDGVPVNAFGGAFDFAHIPSVAVDHVEVIRGAQSAIHGSYANSGVVNFVTRKPEPGLNLEVLAEGGTFRERRFGITGTGTVAGFGLAVSGSRMDTDGPVRNSDYTNQDLMMNLSRRFGRQSLSVHADFDSSENGVPGPWGSDPKHTFTGIDMISRNKNNFSDYMARYEIDLSERVRQEIHGTFFLNNNGFTSSYGYSLNKDIRAQGESRTIVSVTPNYVAAFGVSETLEQVENSYITAADFTTFPIRRNATALYLENRFEFGHKLFLNAGVRGEFIRTGAIPGDGYTRPFFPSRTISAVNPKLAAAYVLGRTRLHASFGTGIRPPGGFDLAYTDNPSLKPEKTRSFDAGVEQQFFGDRLALDATWFYNRFHDLIVILGGSQTVLSRFQSDNIANSRATGVELSARLRPARWVFLTGSYTRLNSKLLSLEGSSSAQAPFHVGQRLLRRPADSGSAVAGFTRGRFGGDVTTYFRGSALDVEPGLGARNGLFDNPGFINLGVNLNARLTRGVMAYGSLRNALNRRYEDVLGYPAPRLNFVAGLKWSLSRAR